jgi:hypothetical protein
MSGVTEHDVPPVGEEVHMPASSILPLINSASLAATIVGITTMQAMSYIGIVVFLVSTVIWAVKARHELDELPLEHGHH